MKRSTTTILFTILVGIFVATTSAAPGDLDPTFGSGGKVTTGFDLSMDSSISVFVKNTGKIIVVARVFTSEYRIGMLRFDPDGSLDTSFGANGKLVTDLGAVELFPTAAAMQSDGKIIVVGREQDAGTEAGYVVVRFNINGTLDTTFSADGHTIVRFGDGIGASPSAVTVQPNGSIVVVGNLYDAGTTKIGLAKLDGNGALVPTFWAYGIKIFEDVNSDDLYAQAVAVDANGQIHVSGSKQIGPNHYGIVRVFNSDGYLVQNLFFNAAGWLMSDPNEIGNTRFHSIAFDAAGKVVVAGQARGNGGSLDFLVARFHPDGNLDTSFNYGGYNVLFFGIGTADSASTLIIQDDGKMLAAGHSDSEIAMMRFTTAGLLDSSFGSGGMKIYTKGSSGAVNTAVGANDKIVVVSNYDPQDVLTVRFHHDGNLDHDFNPGSSRTSGWVATNFGKMDNLGQAIAVQNDGKILVAVNNGKNVAFLVLLRFNPDGSLDSSFGFGGRINVLSLCFNAGGNSLDFAVALAMQADGKILVASRSVGPCTNGFDFAVARLNPDGSKDLTFDSDGAAFVDFGSDNDYVTSMAVQDDGKIILAGSTMPEGDTNYNFAVARFNTNGTLDTTFSSDGKTMVEWGDLSAHAYAVGVQPSHLGGKIVVAGHNSTFTVNGPEQSFAMFRFNSNGTGDAQFGSGGRVTTDFGTDTSIIYDIVLYGTKIIAVGISGNSPATYDFAVARYNLNGSPDTTFDVDGKVTTGFGLASDIASSVHIQSDGKIVVAGSGRGSGETNDNFALARYNTNGTLDATFNLDGKLTTSFANFADRSLGVAIQADGKILATGYTYTGTNYDVALARYQP